MNNTPQTNQPREQSFYQTGSTRPPKNHRGLIAFLLIALILVGSVAGALGIQNLRLLRQLTDLSDNSTSPVRFAAAPSLSETIASEPADNADGAMRSTLGLTGHALSAFDQMVYRLPQGFYITAVDKASDTAFKGILPGDILLRIDGVRITDADSARTLLDNYQPGDTVTLVTYRSGKQYTHYITVGEEP